MAIRPKNKGARPAMGDPEKLPSLENSNEPQGIKEIQECLTELRTRLNNLKSDVDQNKRDDIKSKAFEVLATHRETLRKEKLSKLYTIESAFPGALSILFLNSPSSTEITEGTVDFGNARLAERYIGLGDFSNFKADYVRVESAEGEVYYGYRKNDVDFNGVKRRGFIDPDKDPPYIAIFSGTKFKAITLNEYLAAKNIDTTKSNASATKSLIPAIDSFQSAIQEDNQEWLTEVKDIDERTEFYQSLADKFPDYKRGEELWQDPTFLEGVSKLAGNIGVPTEWLKRIFHKESRNNPQAINPYSDAIGLIQFMPTTAKDLGTSTSELAEMNAVQQLEYVEKYFRPYRNKINSPSDLYLAVFYPASLKRDSDYIIGSEKGDGYAREVARQNAGMKKHRRDAYITKQDVIDWYEKRTA